MLHEKMGLYDQNKNNLIYWANRITLEGDFH